MSTLVSTGQITIVDNNDAKPISLLITANSPQQQIYTKDSSTAYSPDNVTVNLVLTPKMYVGSTTSTTELTTNIADVTNRKWSKTVGGGEIYSSAGTLTQDATNFVATDGTTAVAAPFTVSANGLTLTIKGNLKSSISSYPIYFEADYTDPVTKLVSHVIALTELNVLSTGTNAVYIQYRGKTSIESSISSTKNAIPITADLMRSTGVERNSLTYKWYDVTTGTATQISTSSTAYATTYAITDTATNAVPVISGTLGANVPAAGSGNTYTSAGVGTGNTLTIAESGVNKLAVFRVDITSSADSKTYSGYFNIFDYSDPYTVTVVSSAGDKLQNGTGSTVLTPQVYYGDQDVNKSNNGNNITAWTFDWVFYDRNGKRAGFVDTGSNSGSVALYNTGLGRPITGSSSTTLTFATQSNALAIASNNMVKVVDASGNATYYEITAATTTTVTLASAPAILSLTDYPLPVGTGTLVGSTIYACTLNGTRSTTGTAGITVTGTDIDAKGRITCSANRP